MNNVDPEPETAGEIMNDSMKMWAIDDANKGARLVQSASETETEKALEEVLVSNPEMLMPGLTLVSRQSQTDKGNLDLLGVDADGRLVVFELKKGTLTREAVAQVIDYGSWLESQTETELAMYVASQSGKNGIDKIDDFEAWYDIRRRKQLVELKPIRMVLVGLGADARAHRMVEFLAQRDVDISLLKFCAYTYQGQTLLARHVEGSGESSEFAPGRTPSQAERRRMLTERAKELGMDDLWEDAIKTLGIPFDRDAKQASITFSLPGIRLPGRTPPKTVNVYSTHSVAIDSPGKIRVTFFPAAVHVCKDRFEIKGMPIRFKAEKPPNAPQTEQVEQQRFCQLNGDDWNQHKKALTALVNDVHEAWLEVIRSGDGA